jgi:hypothetical protein
MSKVNKKDKMLEQLRGIEKLKASPIKSPDYVSPLEDEIMKVKGGAAPAKEIGIKIPGANPHINTRDGMPVQTASDWAERMASKLKGGGSFNKTLGSLGKKAAGIIPLAGAGIAALHGDPAMAAEELAMDIPGAEAIRTESIGESPEEEALMLAEDQARKKYSTSPAAQGAKLAKLRAMMGKP